MQNYHNVSVRLTDDEYNKLLFLLEKFNRMSYGKVSLADVLRTAIKDLHLQESKDMSIPVAIERSLKEDELNALHHKENLDSIEVLEIVQQELVPTEDLKHPLEDSQDVLTDEIQDSKAEDINKVLEALEAELRIGVNSKGKPYTDSYIKTALNKKQKELLK